MEKDFEITKQRRQLENAMKQYKNCKRSIRKTNNINNVIPTIQQLQQQQQQQQQQIVQKQVGVVLQAIITMIIKIITITRKGTKMMMIAEQIN